VGQGVTLIILLAWLFIGPGLETAEAVDPVLQQAQQELVQLGYDPGVADGLYGSHTREALEAFQRDQNLPVSGVLDAATLRALDRATAPVTDEAAESPRHGTPMQIVLLYLRLYANYPAHVLPYVTAGFLGTMTPQEWIEYTRTRLAEQDFSYQTWQVEHVEIADDVATVTVHVRASIQGQEVERQEIFTVVRIPENGWFIDAWQAGPLPRDQVPARPDVASKPGS
jgi:hypothetical protein